MPDPMTILGNASAIVQLAEFAYNFAEALYSFVKLKPDHELQELAAEVAGFGRVCNLVRMQLEELSKAAAFTISQSSQSMVGSKLAGCFDETVADCRRTMTQLEEIITDLKGSGSNWEKKVQFLRKKDVMGDIRKRIHSHILALQLVLQSLNINVAHIAPQVANQELLTKIGDLRELIQEQQLMIARLQKRHASETTPGEHSNAEALVRCAQETVSSGESLYEGSMAGGSTIRGSVFGDAIVASKARVADWFINQNDASSYSRLSATTADSAEGSLYSWREETRSSITELSPSSFNEMIRRKRNRQSARAEGFESGEDASSDEDLFELELFQNAVKAAHAAFSMRNFDLAQSKLLASLEIIHGLHSNQRPTEEEVWELRYKLAICGYCVAPLQENSDLEDRLRDVLAYSTNSDAQRRKLLHVSHLLAQLYACTGRLELARSRCMDALRGRRKLLGQNNHEYFCSLALAHRILTLQGNVHWAREYLESIPESERERYFQAYKSLATPDGNDDYRTSMDILPESALIGDLINLVPVSKPPANQPDSRLIGLSSSQLASAFSEKAEKKIKAPVRELVGSHSTTDTFKQTLFIEMCYGTAGSSYDEREADTLKEVIITGGPTPSPIVESVALPPPRWPGYAKIDQDTRNKGLRELQLSPSTTPSHLRMQWVQKLHILPITPITRLIVRNRISDAMVLASPSKTHDSSVISALHLAALFGDTNLIGRLISRGCNPNAQYCAKQMDGWMWYGPRLYSYGDITPLDLAVAARHVAAIRALLKYKPSDLSHVLAMLLDAKWLSLTNCWNPEEILDVLRELKGHVTFGIRNIYREPPPLLYLVLEAARTYTRFGFSFWLPIIRYLLDLGADRRSVELALISEHTTALEQRLIASLLLTENAHATQTVPELPLNHAK